MSSCGNLVSSVGSFPLQTAQKSGAVTNGPDSLEEKPCIVDTKLWENAKVCYSMIWISRQRSVFEPTSTQPLLFIRVIHIIKVNFHLVRHQSNQIISTI